MSRRKFIGKTARAGAIAAISPSFLNTGPAEKKPDICIFSKHLQWLNYEDMADLAAELGFTGIDLTVRPGGHVNPGKVKSELPQAVEAIRARGLQVPMITTAITDPEDPLTADIIETAGKLGIGIYRTGWFRFGEDRNVKDLLEHATRQMQKLQELNEASNIRAAYQNHSGNYLGSSGWDLLHIVEELDPKWTGVQFDICHATVEGPQSWPHIFELLAPWINSIDIKDFIWKVENSRGRVEYVPLGKGAVDLNMFFDQIEKHSIQADYSVHYEYSLGGAEHGHRELEISRDEFIRHVSADLQFLKKVMNLL